MPGVGPRKRKIKRQVISIKHPSLEVLVFFQVTDFLENTQEFHYNFYSRTENPVDVTKFLSTRDD